MSSEKQTDEKPPVSTNNGDPSPTDGDRAIGESYAIDPKVERKVLRKTDLVILPIMWLVFFVQYLDKQALSYASVYGIIQDLNLHGTQYSWCSSIFFIGQLVSQYPFMYIASRAPLVKLVGITILLWGGVCMAQAGPNNYRGFLVVRFFLGLTEGAVSPAFVTLTSIWYRKSEHATRIGQVDRSWNGGIYERDILTRLTTVQADRFYISANAVAQVIGSLIMYGVGESLNSASLAAWRISFLICGAMTIVVGLMFYILVPHDGPGTAWFLTSEERLAAAWRLEAERDGGDQTSFSMDQFKEAMTDWKTLSSFSLGILVTAPAPIIYFASLVINNLGYTPGETLLYGCPAGAIQFAFIWAVLLGCKLLPHNRLVVAICATMVPLTGSIMLLALPLSADWGVILGAWLGTVLTPYYFISLSLNASNVKGNTKRAIVNAWFYVGYTAGGVGWAQLWQTDQAPRYLPGLIAGIAGIGLTIAQFLMFRYFAARRNRIRDERQAMGLGAGEYTAGEDMTDKQDAAFRYSY